jgi:hypothetical protein
MRGFEIPFDVEVERLAKDLKNTLPERFAEACERVAKEPSR